MITTNFKCLLQLFACNLQVFFADFANILGTPFVGCLYFFININPGADPETLSYLRWNSFKHLFMARKGCKELYLRFDRIINILTFVL